MRLAFVVPGPPKTKDRARVVRGDDGKTRAFTPKETAAYEKHVAIHAIAARCKVHRWPWQDKSVVFEIKIDVFRNGRGDWDNYAKAITDACNGVLWQDDRQIVDARVTLHNDKNERVEVAVMMYGGLAK